MPVLSDHAYLSPSAASRWLYCSGAPRLEMAVGGDGGSGYADEGTRAHEAAAAVLCECRRRLCAGDAVTAADVLDLIALQGIDGADDAEAIAAYVGAVLDAVDDPRCMAVETAVDASAWCYGRRELYGTADALVWSEEQLDVFDLKFGKGVRVSAVNNPQLMIYALGALETMQADYNIKTVVLHICQTRLHNISEWELSVEALRRWGMATLRPAALAALSAQPVTKAGVWCRFCKAKATCRSIADGLAHTVAALPDPLALTPAEAAGVLPRLPQYKAWLEAVEGWAVRAALAGTTFPGMKLVRTAGRRVITDTEALRRRLQAEGVEADKYMTEPELQSLTVMERNIGRRRFAAIAGELVTKSPGRPALAADDDPREAWDASDALRDFENI